MKRKNYLASIGKMDNKGSITYTFASKFLLPIIGFTIKDFGNSLINTHITEGDKPELVVILDPNIDDTVSLLVKMRIVSHYLNDETIDDELVIRFTISKAYYNVLDKFKKVHYSAFDEFYKRILTRYYGEGVIQNGVKVSMYDTIYPRYEKRKNLAESLGAEVKYIQEVLDSPEMDYEIYKSLEQLNTGQLNEQGAGNSI